MRAAPRALIVLLLAVLLPLGSTQRAAVQSTRTFAAQVAALSEPGGYFDTDNLISNERSYLQVVADLERAGLRGGAYIGVGPDQNFSYMAILRPSIAFIVDVRRDNLLLHVLFKALFGLGRTRVEYLALLLGRPVPEPLGPWRSADIERIVAHLDAAPLQNGEIDRLRARVDRAIKGFGLPLSGADFETIGRFHRRFVAAGLLLRFESTGRPPQTYYPTYRELLLETDSGGKRRSFVASEDAFHFVKDLHSRDLVLPVVGDLAGPSALAGIGRLLAARGERLSAFYASNVEFYLFRDGRFPRFVANLRAIPHGDRAVIIRSVFRPWLYGARAGDASVSRTQRIDDLLAGFAGGRVGRYQDLLEGRQR